eukprot:6936583-Prorocentrum_lima.AAC.1
MPLLLQRFASLAASKELEGAVRSLQGAMDKVQKEVLEKAAATKDDDMETESKATKRKQHMAADTKEASTAMATALQAALGKDHPGVPAQ